MSEAVEVFRKMFGDDFPAIGEVTAFQESTCQTMKALLLLFRNRF